MRITWSLTYPTQGNRDEEQDYIMHDEANYSNVLWSGQNKIHHKRELHAWSYITCRVATTGLKEKVPMDLWVMSLK